jgi:hypothetical protein
MYPKIGLPMTASISGNLRQPWAGNHNARRTYPATFERLYRCPIDRMGNPEVVTVNDQEPLVSRIAKPLEQRLPISLAQCARVFRFNKRGGKRRENRGDQY